VTLGGSVPAAASGMVATHLTPADLDGDGLVDVVASKPGVSFWRQVPGGQFTPAASIAAGGTAVVMDLDGDGQVSIVWLDIAYIRASEFVAPFVLGPPVDLVEPYEGGGTTFAAAADLDGDGHPDLLADHDGVLSTWLGNGTGGLLPPIPAGGTTT